MSESLLRVIAAHSGGLEPPLRIARVGGGDINEAYAVRGADGGVFVKLHRNEDAEMFAAEHAALTELRSTATVNVPAALDFGRLDKTAYLALELLEFGSASESSDAALGTALARLHRIEQPYFGWHRDNFVGSTPQPNPRSSDWLAFFAEHRLRHQVELLLKREAVPGLGRRCQRVIDGLPDLFAGHRPRASLLHGDLWGGNHGALADGRAVVFDPASYYGCRETDLAMTELFGGFGTAFYRAYEAEWPLHPGYPRRKPLYQLYHVLNHANLFGGGYVGQAQRLMERMIPA